MPGSYSSRIRNPADSQQDRTLPTQNSEEPQIVGATSVAGLLSESLVPRCSPASGASQVLAGSPHRAVGTDGRHRMRREPAP
jgi:hypothetical protein